MLKTALLTVLIVLTGVRCQENAASYIAKPLLDCYNKSVGVGRAETYPYNLPNFLALIRKIETGKSVQNDREISREILHRFKQDGIIKLNQNDNPFAIPYTPRGFQQDKNVIFLRTLVPGNAFNFPNETLNSKQQCSLHFMLSNAFNNWKRGDEHLVCSKMQGYHTRTRRDTNPKTDVESFLPFQSSRRGNFQEDLDGHSDDNPNDNVEAVTDINKEPRIGEERGDIFSECPLEYGVIHADTYGAVQIGTVISGIAAGREPQKINIEEFNYICDNRYAATLAGDLSEAALHQGAAGNPQIKIGKKGHWNSTAYPKWYFIDGFADGQMTDAEIRGGLDGLILGLNIERWKEKASSLKISSLLDMYYSSRGVFSSRKYRSCNRYALFTEVKNSTDLEEQTIAYSFLLNKQANLRGTVISDGIITFSKQAVNSLIEYVPTMFERACEQNDLIIRSHSNTIIILDTSWPFDEIQQALTYILNNLDINIYNSNFSIISARDTSKIVNDTYNILDYHDQYNSTVHNANVAGFDVSTVFRYLETTFIERLDYAKQTGKVGTQSQIVLFVPYQGFGDVDQQTASSQRNYFRNAFPDVKFFVLGKSSKELHGSLVNDVSLDAFNLPTSTEPNQIIEALNPLITTIKQVPRRTANADCGSQWNGGSKDMNLEEYVDPRGINFYRLAPNYFFNEGSRSIEIKNYGYGTLAVCMSRQNVAPSLNSTSNTNCQNITGTEKVGLDLPQSCDGYDLNSCPHVYISVQGIGVREESTTFRCTDVGCRFPDNFKYSLSVKGLDCASNGSKGVFANVMLLISTVIVSLHVTRSIVV